MLKRLIRYGLVVAVMFVSSQVLAQGCASDSCVGRPGGINEIFTTYTALGLMEVTGPRIGMTREDFRWYLAMNGGGCGGACGMPAVGGGL
jgi:hypothetical protein